MNTEQTKSATQNRLIARFLIFLRDRLNLEEDKADPEETSEYIRRGVEFKGTNIWILIFAIFIASVGLNVNSTAVIIGAMLISPLMGPIMGIGLGAGVNDFSLIKKAGYNLALMVGISVATSTLYFLLSPLSDAQSELLARTQPTIWDVLIALFGGLAGIVAGSRREKSNAIPGVAIATALMPPLCTAGFGLATAQWSYFFGAFYLFTINSVFISVSTLIVVRFLKYPQKEFLNELSAKRVKRWITIFVVLVTLPSLYIAFNLVRNTVFEREAMQFVNDNFTFTNAQVISRNVVQKGDVKRIEIALLGEPVSPEVIENIELKMNLNERLKDAELIVRQGATPGESLDLAAVERLNQSMKAGIIEDLYKKNELALQSKDEQIKMLENEIFHLRSARIEPGSIPDEIAAFYIRPKHISLMQGAVTNLSTNKNDTITFAYLSFDRPVSSEDKSRLSAYLTKRTMSDSLRLVLDN